MKKPMKSPAKPIAGSRMSQTRADAATQSAEAKRKALKRTVKDKSTGAMVFPLNQYKDYTRAQEIATQARIETNSANYARQQANSRRGGNTKKSKNKKGGLR